MLLSRSRRHWHTLKALTASMASCVAVADVRRPPADCAPFVLLDRALRLADGEAMSRSARMLIAGVLVLVGVAAALYFGGQVGMCLGPLGVTAVQCARATGVVPVMGLGVPIFAVTVAAATLILAPIRTGRRAPARLGGILGGALGGAAFLALRPLTMEGFDSTGAWISIVRPLDPNAMTTVVVLGALLGAVVAELISRVRQGRSARSAPSGR
jgi:hypothetical protein